MYPEQRKEGQIAMRLLAFGLYSLVFSCFFSPSFCVSNVTTGLQNVAFQQDTSQFSVLGMKNNAKNGTAGDFG